MGNSIVTYNKYKSFLFFIKKYKLTELVPPQDLQEVFSKFAGGGSYMSTEQLHRFLVEHQGEESFTLSDSEKIIDRILQLRRTHTEMVHVDQNREREVALDDIFRFLLLDDFNGPSKNEVHHDMNAPLSHYFIYTGHNSYLTGNQLSSDCSDVPIIKALQLGVRVIELDLWPNSAKDDIDVVHGRTLTTPVSLLQCLKSIKEYAFVKSRYPVIITLEDHLTPDLQAKVAELTTQTFGDMLYLPPTEEPMTEFPSPESLKDRVLISTKPPKEYLDVRQFKDTSDNEREVGEEGSVSPALSSEADEKLNGSDVDEEGLNPRDKKPDQQSVSRYKRLITIHAGKPKGNIRDHLIMAGNVKRLSLSEMELEKASLTYGAEIVRFTQKNIIRVYPKGTRVNSSNYRPHIGWMYGAQMVALNMQGHGKSLRYMQGMFRANGGCGYVKKPEFLLAKGPNNECFDPKKTLPAKKTLKVKVYLGHGWSSDFSKTHFDTFSPPDFYTKICIVGVPADKVEKKTKVIHDDWFPVWDEEFDFPLSVPALALLSIEVREYDKHEKDDFGGQICLPIPELKSGFRSVPMYDKKGEKLKSVKLLIRFQFTGTTTTAMV